MPIGDFPDKPSTPEYYDIPIIPQWEYYQQCIDLVNGAPPRLVELGKQGWELVAISPWPNTEITIFYIFKRRIINPPTILKG